MRSRSTDIFLMKNSSRSRRRARNSPRAHTQSLASFRSTVWRYWRREGRHALAWRSPSLKLRRTKETLDPYKILVSEVMLQQTQVSRVKEKYSKFLKAFPNVHALAKASLTDVLKRWSGLGYNRRGKYLHETAKEIVTKHKGRVPSVYSELVELPGVGDYTARAVRVFAYNESDILIETNVRAATIHHFFPGDAPVADQELMTLLSKVTDRRRPREWNWALMDYGAHVKKLHGNPARRSARYKKQSKFKGSLRQVRGAILRSLHDVQNPMRSDLIGFPTERVDSALKSLARDGLIVQRRGRWKIA